MILWSKFNWLQEEIWGYSPSQGGDISTPKVVENSGKQKMAGIAVE